MHLVLLCYFTIGKNIKTKGAFSVKKFCCCSVVDDDDSEDWLFVGAESLGIGAESLEIDAELLEDVKTDFDVWLAVDGVRRLLAKSFCVHFFFYRGLFLPKSDRKVF